MMQRSQLKYFIVRRLIVLAIIFISNAQDNHAQDLKAGEINVRHISGLTYEATVTLYQNTSTFIYRPFIVVNWGQLGLDTLLSSITGCEDSNTIAQVFRGTHTYIGAGIDSIWCTENFRMANIQNISNSINENLVLKYDLKVGLPGLNNSSPVFANCAHDFWECCNWVYNPGASDPDLDSLSYKLIQPFTTNYTFPDVTLDSITGDMTFNPIATGYYSFCIQIDEWRNFSSSYVLVGTTYRQIQIDVWSLTGVNEYDDHISFNLFPNPFSTKAIIESKVSLRNATLTIDNCFGERIRQINNINDQSFTLSREDLSNGLYLLRITQDGKLVMTKKIIISD